MIRIAVGCLSVALLLIAWSPPARAVPAAGLPEVIVDADGSTFVGTIRGDEWTNWIETLDGFTVAKGDDGNWYYVLGYDGRSAVLDATRARGNAPSYLVHHAKPASLGAARSSSGARTAGPRSIPVGAFSGPILFLLAEFSDRMGSTSAASWAAFISDHVADYYAAVSYGAVELTPVVESFGDPDDGVVGWIDLGYPHPDPGSEIADANRTVTRDAILAADPYIDFAAFDGNHDGYLDPDELSVVVIVAGFERAYGSDSPSVWGHRGSIECCGGAPVVDGVVVSSPHKGGGYAQFGEIHGDHQATLGVMVHELGHLLFDLPDLYDGDFSSPGAGFLSVMSHGAWGSKFSDAYLGMTPVAPDAWIKSHLGWVAAAKGTGVETVVAGGSPGADATNTVFRVPTLSPLEYFLVENRQSTGYDQGLESLTGGFGGGVAIWHVDEVIGGNGLDFHRLLDLEEAHGFDTHGSTTSMYFVGNATSFGDGTTPNSRRYDGSSTGKSVETLSTSAGVMSVAFSTPLCGDGSVGPGEMCEGADAGPCPTGTCDVDCFCPAATCGNAIVEDGENCEGANDSACPGACGTSGADACRCPTSDTCPAARIIAALPYADTQDTRPATSAATTPTTCGHPASLKVHSVWYTLVASATGPIAVTTLGTNYHHVTSVFTGSCGSPIAVACGVGVRGVAPSRTVFGAVAGTTYWIEIASNGAGFPHGGSLVLHVDDAPACAPTPQPCRTPIVGGRAAVALTDASPDDGDQVQWTWAGGDASGTEFGDPVHTAAYQLCIYDAGGSRATFTVPPGGLCRGKPCWTAKSGSFRYRDASRGADGIGEIALRSGTPGKGKLRVKGKGANLPMPSLVGLASPVTVQLKSLSDDAACWSAQYGFPPATKNDGVRFKDKSD